MTSRPILVACTLSVVLVSPVRAQTADDSAAVRAAVSDCVEGSSSISLSSHRDVMLRYVAALSIVVACSDTTPPETVVELEPRRGHSLVYDEARHEMLLFGGWGAEQGQPAGDRSSTWTLVDGTWTRRASVGPSPRHNALVTYDAARRRVVLFGGIVGLFPNEQFLRDTWEWDGSIWTKVAETGPSARVHASMGYDRVRQRVILYGGFVPPTNELRDIWEWNGSAWTQSSVNGPSGTVASGAAHDEKAGTFLLFSATGASTMVMDTYNGLTLSRLAASAPNCILTLAPLGPTRGGLLSLSVCQPNNVFQTALWNGSAWSTLTGTQPLARASHAIAYDRDRDRVVLFGGERLTDGALFGDTWEFDGTAWTQIGASSAWRRF